MTVLSESKATTARPSGARYYIGGLVLGVLLALPAGWFAHQYRYRPDSAEAVVSNVLVNGDRVHGICLKTSPLGPIDGTGTCGNVFLADGVIDDPKLLVDKRVHVTKIPGELMPDGGQILLIDALVK